MSVSLSVCVGSLLKKNSVWLHAINKPGYFLLLEFKIVASCHISKEFAGLESVLRIHQITISVLYLLLFTDLLTFWQLLLANPQNDFCSLLDVAMMSHLSQMYDEVGRTARLSSSAYTVLF